MATESAQSLPVVFLMGPTASGKTGLALHLCSHLPCEIISVDSAMVYRGMDIGTAKPGIDILAKFPHHLIDIRDPSETYSAGEFREDALQAIRSIHARNRVPLLVGGTGLYFRALESGIADLPSADDAIRRRLSETAEKHGWPYMHARLHEVDPDAAARIHPNDPQRIQRALEVYEISGKALTSYFAETNGRRLPFSIRKIVISPSDRSVLHARIRQRFEAMMEFGLLAEVKTLYARNDLSPQHPSMRVVGYRQAWQYLEGKWNQAEMVEKAIVATRQLARRQLTWLRAEQEIQWFDSQEADFETNVLRFLLDDPTLAATV